MKRMRPLALALIALAALAGCHEAPPPPMYEAVPVTRRDIIVSASAAGTIEPITTVDVKSKASGEIVAVYVDTGDSVKTGQLLVKVDQRQPYNALKQAAANLEVAKAQLANAQAQLKRSEQLHQSQAITDQEYEQARLQAATAQAQLVSAQRNLQDARIAYEDTDVRAPSDGIILQRNIEPGTVISSAMSNVSGGTVLLQMANLDTVEVRSLVDETDIGKIAPGMDVTITVDAYPNRQFDGDVLKIEPEATIQQNVTMFPVLVRIPNPGHLLRPGMNTEVEVHIGERRNVLAIPNAALRTPRDLASAAQVLGLDPADVQQQLAAASETAGSTTRAAADTTPADTSQANVLTLPDGRRITLPQGVTADQVRAIFSKMRSGGGPAALSSDERAILTRLRSAFGNRGRGGRGGRGTGSESTNYQFGGNYIVFALRGGVPVPVRIRTGLTDLDYSEIVSGLSDRDTVLVLPSASLVAAQQEFQQRVGNFAGLPGVQRRSSNSNSNSRGR